MRIGETNRKASNPRLVRAAPSGTSFATRCASFDHRERRFAVTETTEERVRAADELAAAARDTGMEQLEGAKGRLADNAERVASAVERTADELEGDGDAAISGFGRSVASLMRQMAGGLRERDVEQFADELGALARRNPAVFLAGSVALGFGVARFFKARAPHRSQREYDSRIDFDSDERLDLSRNPSAIERPTDAGAEDSGLRGGQEP
jgi:hypothetical protein